MTRTGGASPGRGKPGGTPGLGQQGGGTTRPNVSAVVNAKPNGGFQRPTGGNLESPKSGTGGQRTSGTANPPKIGGERPGVPGKTDRPNVAARPGGGASSSQLNDFLGGGGRPSEVGKKPDLGQSGRPNVGKVGDRGKDSPNVNVGNVNIGNSVDYSKNQKTWMENQHATGNQVRVNAGNRYAGVYNNGGYRRGVAGGYPYYNGWNNRGDYYGWRPVTYAAVGTFMGAAWASSTSVLRLRQRWKRLLREQCGLHRRPGCRHPRAVRAAGYRAGRSRPRHDR